jgi:hypothetical protein
MIGMLTSSAARRLALQCCAVIILVVAPRNAANASHHVLVSYQAYSGSLPLDQYYFNFPAPMLNADFDDHSFRGSVTLTLSAGPVYLDPSPNQYYPTEYDFNLDPSFNPSQLVFSAPVKTGVFDAPVISVQADQFNASGAGNYDIRFSFSSATGHQFRAGDSVQYVITGIPLLAATSFDVLPSNPNPSIYPFPITTMHIHGDNGTDGWVLGNEAFFGNPIILGDYTFDGFVDQGDLPALLNALSDMSKYKSSPNNALYGSETRLRQLGNYEMLPDNNLPPITNLDIQEQLDYFADHGVGSLTAVPEPDSFVLICIGGASLALCRRCTRRREIS